MSMLSLNFFKKIKNKVGHPENNQDSKIKISAVVPTYNTDPEALKRLVNSIDSQTMPKNEYEMIFVDDGSTTNIYEELKKLASSRTNVIVKQIPNSGWGSRPRNIGTKMARGHYILFLDHDDTVFPETFERVYRYGIENDADVVNGKEVRTKGWSWGWDQFKENQPSAEGMGIQSLLPMTPHKFYRREFLLEHGIEFNEGARVLWEDVYFNTKVFSCGAKVAILSDYPTYYWIDTGANNSSTFGQDPHEKWNQIRKLLQFFKDTLPDGNDLTYMLTHWYQSRVLGILGQYLLKNSEERITVEFAYVKKIASDLIPKSIDQNLTPINKIRAYLLRNNMLDELKKLAQHDKNVTARSYASDISWKDGRLHIAAAAKMTVDDKKPYILHQMEGRIIRDLPEELKSIIPAELLDLTYEVKNGTYLSSIKGRNSRVTWEVPAETSEVKIVPLESSKVTLTGNIEFYVDLHHAAMGAKLDYQPWDVAARFSAAGYTFHRGIVAKKGYGSTALVDGLTAVAYRNKSELLTIDIGSKVRSIVGTSKPRQSDLSVVNEGKTTKIIINLPNTHVHGKTRIKGEVLLNSLESETTVKGPAELIGDEQGARVEAMVKLPMGQYSITTKFEGRKSETALLINDRSANV